MSVEHELAENGFETATFLLGSVLYVLMLNETVQYVGSSGDILLRLMRHRRQGRVAFNVVWVKARSREYAFGNHRN